MVSSQAARMALAVAAVSSVVATTSFWSAYGRCSDTPCLVVFILLGLPFLVVSTLGVLVFGWLWDVSPRALRWVLRGLYAACLLLQVMIVTQTW